MAKLDHPIMHQDSRGGGDGYTHRREKSWRKMGITFNGQFLKWRVFIECVKLQGHRCAVCGIPESVYRSRK